MFFVKFGFNIFLIIAAIVPALALMYFLWKSDKREKEPFWMLFRLAVTGMLTTYLAGKLNWYGQRIFYFLPERAYCFFFYFLVVGPVEEGVKYLALRINTWNDKNFNYTFDAFVYSCFVSLGFALWENISYVLRYGFGTALLRAVTSIPGHCSFAVFMGLFYGTAKRYRLAGDAQKCKKNNWLAWIIPALIHGAYDYVAVTDSSAGSATFFVFIGLMFLVAYITLKRANKQDKELINNE